MAIKSDFQKVKYLNSRKKHVYPFAQNLKVILLLCNTRIK